MELLVQPEMRLAVPGISPRSPRPSARHGSAVDPLEAHKSGLRGGSARELLAEICICNGDLSVLWGKSPS